MIVEPFGDRILVKREDFENKTKTGIIIPDNGREKPSRGTIAGVGKDVESNLDKGTTVLFGKYCGTEIEIEGDAYLVLQEADVLVTIKGDK